MKFFTTALVLVEAANAFPWVSLVPDVDSSMLVERQQPGSGPGSEATCPFNANHVFAAPITAKYPYNGAKGGVKGKETGGFLVPAKGDTEHRYIAPKATDIRGPCPGLVGGESLLSITLTYTDGFVEHGRQPRVSRSRWHHELH